MSTIDEAGQEEAPRLEPASAATEAGSPALVVATSYGPVRGRREGDVVSWKGVRFAAAPTGAGRWRPPEPPRPWREVADAGAFGPVAPQQRNPLIDLGPGAVEDEDCLFLNVWAPADRSGGPRPVLFWIHGGAYVLGATTQPLYDASSLVRNGRVVVVSAAYRLGALGFADLRSLAAAGSEVDANPALRDILFALQWVQRNIAGFGGDPGQVTIFGESAGAGCVTTLLAVPAAEGLFHRAIAQSSPATSVYSAERAARVARLLAERAGVSPDAPGALGALEQLDAQTLTRAAMQVFAEIPTRAPGTLAFAPVVDGELLPEHPVPVIRRGDALPVPLLIGTNRDETTGFRKAHSPLLPIDGPAVERMFADIAEQRPELVLPERAQLLSAYAGMPTKAVLSGITRDIAFRMPTIWLVEGHSRGAPAWLYRYDWAPPMLRVAGLGAAHATELPYVWGNLPTGHRDVTFRLGGRRTGVELSARMQRRWLSFALGGEPEGPEGSVPWPAYDESRRATLVIDRHDRLVDDLDRSLRAAWGEAVLSFL